MRGPMRMAQLPAALLLTLCAVYLFACDEGGSETPEVEVTGAALECKTYMEEKRARLSAEAQSQSIGDAAEMVYSAALSHQFDPANPEGSFDGHYRADVDGTGLEAHPGCSTDNLYYGPGAASKNDPVWYGVFGFVDQAPGEVWQDSQGHFKCAAKAYAGEEDPTKPVVLLIQGNSVRPHTWEKFVPPLEFNCLACNEFESDIDALPREQMAEKLVARGYKTIAVDKRSDVISGQWEAVGSPLNSIDANDPTNNRSHNMDHGWATPLVQNFIEAALMEYAGNRKLVVIGHSMGVTTARDALRRTYVRFTNPDDDWNINPFAHLKNVILLSGGNHGVSTYDGSPAGGGKHYCAEFKNMKGKVACEMGSRAAYAPTYFGKPLNGPEGLFETPCADGSYAFGHTDACYDDLNTTPNVVRYLTIVMEDEQNGTQKDKYVSEQASKLDNDPCVSNQTVPLSAFDTSGYLLGVNHFGTQRVDSTHELIFNFIEAQE